MHEFRHHLHDPYTMLANSYGKLQNFDKSLAFVEKALQCFPAKFAHHWVCLKEQIHLAQNYIFIGRLSDAKICLQNAMTVCRHSMGIDKELFQKLFPLSAEARTILCTTVSIFNPIFKIDKLSRLFMFIELFAIRNEIWQINNLHLLQDWLAHQMFWLLFVMRQICWITFVELIEST